MKHCKQKTSDGDCGNPGAYRYTWPGKNESVVCEEHLEKLKRVAYAMGVYIQLIPIPQRPEPKGEE